MAKVVKGNNVIAVVIRNQEGTDTTLCAKPSSLMPSIVFGSLGGIVCTRITQLRETAPDGAKSRVEMKGLSPFGLDSYTGRSSEPPSDLLESIREAGFEEPKIDRQSWIGSVVERARHKFGLAL